MPQSLLAGGFRGNLKIAAILSGGRLWRGNFRGETDNHSIGPHEAARAAEERGVAELQCKGIMYAQHAHRTVLYFSSRTAARSRYYGGA